jgi:hypothetical protein
MADDVSGGISNSPNGISYIPSGVQLLPNDTTLPVVVVKTTITSTRILPKNIVK